MKTLKDYLQETIRRYGAVGASPGMGYSMKEGTIPFTIQYKTAEGDQVETMQVNSSDPQTAQQQFSQEYPEYIVVGCQGTGAGQGVAEAAPNDHNTRDPFRPMKPGDGDTLEESAELKLILQRAKLIE